MSNEATNSTASHGLRTERDLLTWRYVDKWAAETPNAEAVVFENKRLTYAQFKSQVDAAAKAFLEIGVQPGDRIALLAMACPEFLITFMAANKIGAMWLGLSPKFTLDELSYIGNDCQPTVLITLNEYLGRDLSHDVIAHAREFPCIKKILSIGGTFDGADDFQSYIDRPRSDLDSALSKRSSEVSPDNDALLMYTSGSTGKPKGVVHTQRSIVENVKAQSKYLHDYGELRSLLHFPINHVAADVEIGFATVYVGGACIMMDRFDPTATLETVERERITLFGQIPAMFLLEMATPKFAQTDWSSVKVFAWSGATASKALLEVLAQIAAKTGAKLSTGYGATEMCGFVTYSDPNDNFDTLATTAGKIVEGWELRIVDENHDELPTGQTGEIAVRGPFLLKEYLNKPDQTRTVLDDAGWYYSGDLAWKDASGNIHINGRRTEMFKTGGENVFPREIEDVLEAHPEILLAAVIGVPHPTYQEVGHAFVMPNPGTNLSADTLQAYCKQRLANFKVPKTFELRPTLPMLPNGKVNKLALKTELNERKMTEQQ